MNSRTTRYCIKQGLVNIKRNKLFSIASIGTIAGMYFPHWDYFFNYYKC